MPPKQEELKSTHTIRKACDFYMRTPKFSALGGKSQYDYERNLEFACVTPVQGGKFLGNIKLKDLQFSNVTVGYDYWQVKHGVRAANYIATCLSIVLNTARRHEVLLSNPVSLIL